MHKEIINHFSRHRTLEGAPNLTPVTSLEDITDGVTICHVGNHGQDVNFVRIDNTTRFKDCIMPLSGTYTNVFGIHNHNGNLHISQYFGTFSPDKGTLAAHYREITTKHTETNDYFLIK
jgi:hypothetical protein